MTGHPQQHDPVTPLENGQRPTWVVACLDCEFSHDAHGAAAEDAIQALAANHQPGHRLIARPVDYSTGWGPQGTAPHPIYGS